MNVHKRALVLAATTIDFEIAADERDELDRHIAGCGRCRADVAGIRVDAEVIGGLPMLRPEHSHAAVPAPVGAPWRAYRLVLVTALVALLAGLAVFAGAQLLQRWNNVVPPPMSTSTASPDATPTAPTLAPSTQKPPAWSVRSLDVATLGENAYVSGLAYANGRFLAVGTRRCEPSYTAPTACWGRVWTSPDAAAWTELGRQASPAVGTATVTSGPDPGLIDVAGAPAGFVAIGYGLENHASMWYSPDGETWTVTAALPGPARVRAVASTPAGWAVVGQVLEGLGDLATGRPRAAIWTSTDGRTWSRVPDGGLFDVGGYFDTMEEPGYGGILDVASDAATVVAVGNSCDDHGRSCAQATWRSTNGVDWERVADGRMGRLTAVAGSALGFTAIGVTCDTDKDPTGCDTFVARLTNGSAWTELRQAAPPVEFVATVASDRFATVLVKDASWAPSLLGSADGLTWQSLGATLATPDFQMTNGAMVIGPAGAATVVGWGMPDAGATAFGATIQLAP